MSRRHRLPAPPAAGGLSALLAQPRALAPATRVTDTPRQAPEPAEVPLPRATPLPIRGTRSPADELRALARARRTLAVRESTAVDVARRTGLTWQQIADLLDVPVQTVHRRFR